MIKNKSNLVPFYCLALLAGCSQAYYGALEKAGIHKREILVDRVGDARESQVEAKEQFASALERFTSVVNVEGGDLEEKYNVLNDELQVSEGKAREVRKRIESVEDVAEALFDEWEKELTQYSSGSLRAKSKKQLADTRRRYETLIGAMRRAEARIDPVLVIFRDQVLYLKHNLNAKAIASLRGELVKVESDTDRLIKELEASIAEADRFIQQANL